MDEKVTVNLGVFLLPLPARTIPSPTLIIPFPPVNNCLINLLLIYQVTYLTIVLLTPFNKIPEFSFHILLFNN